MSKTSKEEIARRRTAAIIAHPDAGKTTLTEKLLLYSGTIHRAGSVKSRKADSYATSDWMDMEKERGISITSSVLQFNHNDQHINLLDTPGHADFSADTYRTLVAADSAVIIIDGTSGVEKQTRKLFKFCRRHSIPFFIFVNKMDQFGLEPLELIDQIESELGVTLYPANWPLGMGKNFQGIYDRQLKKAIFFARDESHGQEKLEREEVDAAAPEVEEKLGEDLAGKIREEIELLEVAGNEFSEEKFLQGQQAPMFFGSAQTNIGVRSFLDKFVELAPPPRSRGGVNPESGEFSGYIFKIQANMDPNHRDRLAFMRICSGVFEKDMKAEIVRSGKEIKLSQPRQFMAEEREIVEKAYPGDVVGLFDPGIFHIGDSLSSGSQVQFNEVPRFSPEHFARIKSEDAFKKKHLKQGLEELSEEGAVQLFEPWQHGVSGTIVGVVGQLQLEVLQYRLEEEYGVETRLETLPFKLARWIEGEDLEPEKFDSGAYRKLLADKDGYPLLLFKTEFTFQRDKQDHPELEFHDTAPLHRDVD